MQKLFAWILLSFVCNQITFGQGIASAEFSSQLTGSNYHEAYLYLPYNVTENSIFFATVVFHPKNYSENSLVIRNFHCLISDSLLFAADDSSEVGKFPNVGHLSGNSIIICPNSMFPEFIARQEFVGVPGQMNLIPNPITEPLDWIKEIQSDDDLIYEFGTSGGTFPGGESEMVNFILTNFQYPNTNVTVTGTVYVKFIIEKDGSLTNFEIVRGVSEEFDREAIRVISMMPKWIPVEYGCGNPVRSRYVLPIRIETQR